MAISYISQIPANKYLPSANPINITVNSNNNGKCNFRYVCDVYINGVAVFRYKLFPDPNTGWGFFQLSDTINDYLAEYMPAVYNAGITVGTLSGLAGSISAASVYCRFGEEYDNSTNCDGTIQIYPNLSTSNTFYSFYGAFEYEDWPTYNSTDFVNWVTNHISGPAVNFLTNRPRGSAECSYEDTYVLDYLVNAVPVPLVTQLKIQLDTGTTYDINAGTITLAFRRLRATVGPMNINRHFNDTIISANTKWYDVWIETAGHQVTEKFRIKVTKPKTFKTRLGFIGLKGSPEWITFYHRNRESYNIDRKNYKKYLSSRKGNDWSYAVGDRQLTTYATVAQSRHLVSTFVNKEESDWLYELWLSTNVWVEDKPYSGPFNVYRESSAPNSRMLFRLEDGHQVKAGNTVFLFSDKNPDYNGLFTVQSVSDNIIDLGLTYNLYNLSETACGWLVKNEIARYIPIVADQNTIEVKQKAGGLIEYSLQYTESVDKITLRS
jgi:hypothetical protein